LKPLLADYEDIIGKLFGTPRGMPALLADLLFEADLFLAEPIREIEIPRGGSTLSKISDLRFGIGAPPYENLEAVVFFCAICFY